MICLCSSLRNQLPRHLCLFDSLRRRPSPDVRLAVVRCTAAITGAVRRSANSIRRRLVRRKSQCRRRQLDYRKQRALEPRRAAAALVETAGLKNIKSVPSRRGSERHLIHVFLDPHESALISSAVGVVIVRWTNAFVTANGDKTAMQRLAKLFWTFVIFVVICTLLLTIWFIFYYIFMVTNSIDKHVLMRRS